MKRVADGARQMELKMKELQQFDARLRLSSILSKSSSSNSHTSTHTQSHTHTHTHAATALTTGSFIDMNNKLNVITQLIQNMSDFLVNMLTLPKSNYLYVCVCVCVCIRVCILIWTYMLRLSLMRVFVRLCVCMCLLRTPI